MFYWCLLKIMIFFLKFWSCWDFFSLSKFLICLCSSYSDLFVKIKKSVKTFQQKTKPICSFLNWTYYTMRKGLRCLKQVKPFLNKSVFVAGISRRNYWNKFFFNQTFKSESLFNLLQLCFCRERKISPLFNNYIDMFTCCS